MNADKRIDWISKFFQLDDGMPSYDELFDMLEATDSDITILRHRLESVEQERNGLLAQRDSAWDTLNYIEDVEEEIMASLANAQADLTLLMSLFARIKNA